MLEDRGGIGETEPFSLSGVYDMEVFYHSDKLKFQCSVYGTFVVTSLSLQFSLSSHYLAAFLKMEMQRQLPC